MLCVALSVGSGHLHADELTDSARGPLDSGRAVGDEVPSFYVRAVTGPLRNKSVCYVCRNGARPVVMVLLREVEPELKPLLETVDRLVDRNRAAGLRSFGVLLSDDPGGAVSTVQTFAFNNKVAMPLTVATETVGGRGCQAVHPDAAVTVVLYRERRVVARFAYRSGDLNPPRIRDLTESIREFAAQDNGRERVAK